MRVRASQVATMLVDTLLRGLIVLLVVWFQTRSLFLALVTIIECILAFPTAVLPMVPPPMTTTLAVLGSAISTLPNVKMPLCFAT